MSLQGLLNHFLFLIFLFWTSLSLCFLVFLESFPAVFINVSSILYSKFSIWTFIFFILFVCNWLKSCHLMLSNYFSSVSVYNFSRLLFHINLCGLSSSLQFEVFLSSMRVGCFHKILSSIGLWPENVVKVCTERYCVKFVWEMFSEAKTVHCATTLISQVSKAYLKIRSCSTI